MGVVVITDEGSTPATPADGSALFSVTGKLKYRNDGGTIHEIVTDNNAALGSGVITNTMLATDVKMGSLASLTTTAKSSAVAAINEVDALIGAAASASGSIGTSIDTDGTLKAGAVDVEAVIADNVVTAAKIADNVVGAGYSAGSDLTLEAASDRIGAAASASGSIATSIDTDGTLKAGAVDAAAVIADNVIESSNLVHDPYNAIFAPSASAQDGAERWYNNANLSQVTPDAANPYGLPTIRTTHATGGGKRIYLAEAGLKVGDTVSMSVEWLVASGTTARVVLQFLNAAGSGISSAFTTRAGDGTVSVSKVSNQVIPALCTSMAILVRNDSGGGNTDVYAWHLVRGSLVRSTGIVSEHVQTRRNTAILEAARGTSVSLNTRLDVSLNSNGTMKNPAFTLVGGYDPIFRVFAPPNTGGSGTKEDDLSRWLSDDVLSLLVDSANPFGMRTLRFATSAGSTGGVKIHLSEAGVAAGDILSIGVLLKIPSTVTARLSVAWRDSGGTSLGTSSTSYAAGTDATQFLTRTNLTVPVDTSWIDVYAQKNAGTDPIDIYGVWVAFGPTISQDDCEAFGYRARYDIAEMARRGNGDPAVVNPGRLLSWMAALAKISESEAGAKARLAIIGDSITNDTARGIRQLCQRFWADGWANGGVGWISAYSVQYLVNSRWDFQSKFTSTTRTGTWTERVPGSTPAARGLDCSEVESTANGDKYTHVVTCTDATLHYLEYDGGPEFRYQVDGGGWTTVDSDNGGADAWAKVEITGLSSASHSIEWEALDAGAVFFGWEYYDNVGNDIVINKLGHPGATATQWLQMAQTDTWQDALTNLAPDAVLINLGTNENQSSLDFTLYRGRMEDIIDAIQTVLPNADVGLIAPYHTEPGISANRFETTRRWIRQVAVERGLLCIDLSEYMHDVTHMTALDLMDDSIHIKYSGGAIVGKAYYDALKF